EADIEGISISGGTKRLDIKAGFLGRKIFALLLCKF
ncbi:unnamed protein product, partial [marine sediment metagenome]